MTLGEELLVACLKRKDNKVLSVIQRKWLDGAEIRQYKFIMDYYREHGEIIGVRAFCEKFKLDRDGVDARPTYYLNQIKERYIFAVLSDNVPRIIRGVKEDPREKLHELQSIIGSLAVDAVESKDTLYSEDVELRIRDYEERMKSCGVTYLSMGCADLDKTFFGYRKNDLITIGGKGGQGKTWLMCYLVSMLERAILEKEEATEETCGDILFITNEMGEDEIKERLDCIRFKLPYKAFLEGTLTEREKRRYYKGLEKLKSEKSKIRILYSCQTIDELTTQIGLYQPSVVFIDGSYLMEPQRDEGWEKIVYVTRNLKRLAKNTNVPIVNTTQLKRGSSKGASKFALDAQEDFAYSSSYTQDSDIALRMFQDADMKFHDLIGLEVAKGRRVVSGTKLIFQNDLANMLQSVTLPADEPEPERKDDF